MNAICIKCVCVLLLFTKVGMHAHCFLRLLEARNVKRTVCTHLCTDSHTQVVFHALCPGVSAERVALAFPVTVVLYTAHGGLRSTYLASYWHVLFMFCVVLVFCFQVYSADSDVGSAKKVHANLVLMGERYPVEGNADGSYLTLWSAPGVMFGITNLVGNFGTVFVDQAYWQTALAAKAPRSAVVSSSFVTLHLCERQASSQFMSTCPFH